MKTKDDIRSVGLVANPEKLVAIPLLQRAAELAAKAGKEVFADARTAEMADLNAPRCKGVNELARQADLIVVLGGDGTMLGAARDLAGSRAQLLGINIGGMGFLTSAPSAQMEEALDLIWKKDYSIELRDLIRAEGIASGVEVRQLALNDFVISRGTASRLIDLEVSVDGETLTRYRCDGLVICTPTGSTAYSLAAGGAVVSPNTQVMTITPVCPHTLSNRSVIVNMDSVVEVKTLSERLEVFLNADGQVQLPMTAGDSVRISRSREQVRLVRLPGSSFFNTLRQKLGWSGSHV